MATSGTTTFNLDVDEIIDEAFSRIGQEPTSGYEAKTARRSLNLILQSLINKGIFLWTVKLDSFTATQSTATYTLDGDAVDVIEVYIRRSGADNELVRISRQEYSLLPDKDAEGKPTQFFIERFDDSVTMTLWPVPENSTDQVFFYKKTRIEDVNKSRENVEIPIRWMEWLICELAYKLSYKRQNITPQRRVELKSMCDQAFYDAVGEEDDRTSTFLIPDTVC